MRRMNLTTKLMMVVGGVATLVATIAALAIMYLTYYTSEQQVQTELADQALQIVQEQLTVRDGEIGLQEDDGGSELAKTLRDDDLSMVLTDKSQQVIARYGIYRNLTDEEISLFLPDTVIEKLTNGKTGMYQDVESEERGKYDTYTLPLSTDSEVVGYLQLSRLNNVWPLLTRALMTSLLILIPLCWVLAAIIAGWAVRVTMSPMNKLVEYLAKVEIGETTRAMTVPESLSPELMVLVTAFNQLLRRVQATIKREKEVVENISHELKTPLTRASSSLQLVIPKLPKEEGQVVTEVNREILELGRSVEALLRLSLQPNMQGEEGEPWKMRELVSRLGDEEIVVNEVADNMTLRLPRIPIQILMRNLVENASKYRAKETKVRVRGESSATDWEVIVENKVEGKLADTTKLMTRHYREGKRGGQGIGLSIVEAICRQQGLVLKIEREGEMLMVKVSSDNNKS